MGPRRIPFMVTPADLLDPVHSRQDQTLAPFRLEDRLGPDSERLRAILGPVPARHVIGEFDDWSVRPSTYPVSRDSPRARIASPTEVGSLQAMSSSNIGTSVGPWGTASLEQGRSLMLRVGPLSVSVTPHPREWTVAYRREHGDLERFVDARVELGEHALEAPDATERFLVRESSSSVVFVPTLADRSVASRPERPFYVPAGEAANLFLSSPAWVRLSLSNSTIPLVEIPTSISSDTWVGPSTRSGELCYASRTLARTRLDDVPLRPHRVVTPLTIENRAENHLRIDRVNIPCPNLSVYVGERGFLWTEAVTLVREEDGDLARLRIHEGASEPARGGDRLTTPRERIEADSLFRAFSSFFQ